MIKILFCDDNTEQLDLFKKYIKEYTIENNVNFDSRFYNYAEDVLEEWDEYRADIYFLDIELMDGNGLEIARNIRLIDKKAIIVFITEHTECMPEAFEVHAFQFIGNKTDKKVFFKVINEITELFSDTRQKFFFDSYGEHYSVFCDDIVCLYSEKRINTIVTLTGIHRYYGKFSDVYNQLPQNMFAQVRDNFIINLNYIKCISGNMLTYDNVLENKCDCIDITRKYKNRFMENYREYVKGLY